MRIYNDGFFNREGVLRMLATIFTILSYVLLGVAVVFCIVVMAATIADIRKNRKEIPDGILFVSKQTSDIYANLYTDPAEFKDGQVVKMTVTRLNTK